MGDGATQADWGQPSENSEGERERKEHPSSELQPLLQQHAPTPAPLPISFAG